MSATLPRRRVSGRDALGPRLNRAERFAARLRGEWLPRFEALREAPFARLHPDADLPRVALATGLLHYRHQLDAELSGARLQPIVDLCGEELVDRIFAAPPPPPDQSAAGPGVPSAEQLLLVGRSLIERSDVAWARALAARALALVAKTS